MNELSMQQRLEARFPGTLDAYCACGEGWEQIIADMLTELTKLGPAGLVRVVEVKEKFQLLRVYFEAPDYLFNKVSDIVHSYELKSATVCCVCGKSGFLESKAYWASGAMCNICRSKNAT